MSFLKGFKDSALSFAKKGMFKVRKHSPELLLGAGIVSGIAAGVVAYNTKPKIDAIMEEAAATKEKVNEYVENNGYTEEYTQEDHAKDLSIIFTQTAVKTVKEFLPTLGLGALSLTCILSSHNILTKRNAALAAAYQLAHSTLRTYRDRVVERFGEEVDKELNFGIKEVEREEVITDKNGKEKVKKVKETIVEGPQHGLRLSPYARCFDASCFEWKDDPELNKVFLIQMEKYAHDKLVREGYLFLNDVYEMLGFEKTKDGQVVGWVYDPHGTKHGDNWPADKPWDNHVSFGIWNINSEANRRFVNNLEPCIWLDFNVDGNIWEIM